MTDSNSVLLEKRGQVFWITINRPDKRNAINAGVVAGIARGYREAHDDRDVRVIVLTGAGDKAFCAGADLQNSGAANLLIRYLDLIVAELPALDAAASAAAADAALELLRSAIEPGIPTSRAARRQAAPRDRSSRRSRRRSRSAACPARPCRA